MRVAGVLSVSQSLEEKKVWTDVQGRWLHHAATLHATTGSSEIAVCRRGSGPPEVVLKKGHACDQVLSLLPTTASPSPSLLQCPLLHCPLPFRFFFNCCWSHRKQLGLMTRMSARSSGRREMRSWRHVGTSTLISMDSASRRTTAFGVGVRWESILEKW